jgi:hypothetical protein
MAKGVLNAPLTPTLTQLLTFANLAKATRYLMRLPTLVYALLLFHTGTTANALHAVQFNTSTM